MSIRRNPVEAAVFVASLLIVGGAVGTWQRPDLFDVDMSAVVAGPAGVIDGDTLKIQGRKIRLFGIDAIEGKQRCLDASGQPWACGRAATQAVRSFIADSEVSCLVRDQDAYGRDVAVCDVRGQDLNGWIVRNGWAGAYSRYSLDYVAAEEKARSERVGIFAGSFTLPWQWRSQQQGS